MSNIIPIRVLRLARVFAQFDQIVVERNLEIGLPVQPPEQTPLQRAYERHQVLLEQERCQCDPQSCETECHAPSS